MCFGAYHGGKQVGFARVVTDRATMYWLCDVFIAEEYRGKGLGKRLIRCIVECDELQDLVGILGIRDAHGLYEQFGFKRDQNRFMRRAPEQGVSITDLGGS